MVWNRITIDIEGSVNYGGCVKPAELLAGADATVIEMAVIVGGVGFEDRRHQLGEAVADGEGCFGFVVVGCDSEVEAFGDRWVVLKEAVELVVTIFEVVIAGGKGSRRKGMSSRTEEEEKIKEKGIKFYRNTWCMKCFLDSSFPISTACN